MMMFVFATQVYLVFVFLDKKVLGNVDSVDLAKNLVILCTVMVLYGIMQVFKVQRESWFFSEKKQNALFALIAVAVLFLVDEIFGLMTSRLVSASKLDTFYAKQLRIYYAIEPLAPSAIRATVFACLFVLVYFSFGGMVRYMSFIKTVQENLNLLQGKKDPMVRQFTKLKFLQFGLFLINAFMIILTGSEFRDDTFMIFMVFNLLLRCYLLSHQVPLSSSRTAQMCLALKAMQDRKESSSKLADYHKLSNDYCKKIYESAPAEVIEAAMPTVFLLAILVFFFCAGTPFRLKLKNLSYANPKISAYAIPYKHVAYFALKNQCSPYDSAFTKIFQEIKNTPIDPEFFYFFIGSVKNLIMEALKWLATSLLAIDAVAMLVLLIFSRRNRKH